MTKIAEIEKALVRYDTKIAECPFTKKRPPARNKPCPKCEATHSESCRLDVRSAFDFVREVRTILVSVK